MLTAPKPLRPKRSAHASIRGYLYQACLGVERWLDLEENETLLCEGDEDLDRLLLHSGITVCEQVKDYSRSLPPRVVRESIRNFLVAYFTLASEDRRFVFTCTADIPKPGGRRRQLDILHSWKDPDCRSDLVETIRGWVLEDAQENEIEGVQAALSYLDQEKRWADFLDRVEWNLGAPNLTEVRRNLEARLEQMGHPPVAATDRLVWEILSASSKSEPQDRLRDSNQLHDLLRKLKDEFVNWSGKPAAVRLRYAFEDAQELRPLLRPGTRDVLEIAPADRVPSILLQARYEVVPFEGRGKELDEIVEWCGGDASASVQLWYGEGGTGKTRLWIEACQQLEHQGWIAGFLTPRRPDDVARALTALSRGTVPRLVVVDYAASSVDSVQLLLARLADHLDEVKEPKVRLALLDRRLSGWWEELGRDNPDIQNLLYRSPAPRQLPALAGNEEADRPDPDQVFRTASASFAEVCDKPLPSTKLSLPDAWRPLADRALYLYMAALLAVLEETPDSVQDAFQGVLDHEWRAWERGLRELSLHHQLDREDLDRTVASLVLLNGADSRETALRRVERALGSAADQAAVAKIARLLHRFYGGPSGTYLEPLQPDLLGEALVDVALEREPELLDRVLEEADDALRERLLTVLTRLAQQEATATGEPGVRWLERALEDHLEILAEPALRVVVATGEPAGAVLAAVVREAGSDELVRRLLGPFDAAGDWFAVAQRDVAAAATERALRLLPEEEENVSERARLLNNLATRLSLLGRREQALEATHGAVEIRRQLAAQRPIAFLPELARSLNNLGLHLADLGRREQALEATHEAIEIRRQLADQRPEDFLPDLASSLDNLGLHLSSLGRRQQALEATQKAIEIRRQLADQRPEDFLPDLAMGLNNLGNRLSDLGRRQQAMEATHEAVEIYRQLARQRPKAFRPALAISLSNLGNRLKDLGRREQALEAAQEAVEIRRKLARQRPDAFLPDLASSLNNLGAVLSNLGRREQALEVTQEAVEIYRRSARQRPDAFLPDLAVSLNNLGGDLLALGRLEQALEAAEEAVQTLLPFFRRLPRAFAVWMGIFVRNYQEGAKEAGREPDAELVREVEEILASL